MKSRISWRRTLAIVAATSGIVVMVYLGWYSVTNVDVGQLNTSTTEAQPTVLQLARGRVIYDQNCATCHGSNLEGQPNWRERLPNGRLPAPPHDETGHTWHHPDDVLFGIVKYGLVPGKYAPPNHESDMPAFGGVLTDTEIRAVLNYIASHWSPKILAFRAELTRQARERRSDTRR